MGVEGEVGRWVDGMSRGSVLIAGGGLSSKKIDFLHKLQQTANTTKRHKQVCVCVCLQV